MIILKNTNTLSKNKAFIYELGVFLLTYNFYYSTTNKQAK